MTTSLDPIKSTLRNHRLYGLITDVDAVRLFMQQHVICVWDFMSLVKSLQRDVVGTSVPWLPSEYGEAARLINEIVLDEESDELPRGGYGSHFEMYLAAMQELGSDTAPMNGLIEQLRSGRPLAEALEHSTLSTEARQFTQVTFELLEQPLHVRAAVFLHGREDMIPQMFINFVRSLREQSVPCELFLDYLERHIEVDSERHSPMAQKLLVQLCGDSPEKWLEAEQASYKALTARLKLWDAVADKLEQHRLTHSSAYDRKHPSSQRA